jgi:NADPH-dependent glutamate synthase beta subunit-like oxidoreductase
VAACIASIIRTPKPRRNRPRSAWFSILTKEFVDDGKGHVKGIGPVVVGRSRRQAPFTEVAGSEKIWPADLVLSATGFWARLAVGEMLGVES